MDLILSIDAFVRVAEIETPLDLLRHDFACYSYYPWGDKWPLCRPWWRHRTCSSAG